MNKGIFKELFLLVILLSIIMIPKMVIAADSLAIGDVNQDDIIDYQDLFAMQKHIVSEALNSREKWALKDESFNAGDITNDGKIDVRDMQIMYKYIKAKNNSEIANEHPEWLNLEKYRDKSNAEPQSYDIETITLDKESIIIGKDESKTIMATIKPKNAINKELEWRSSDENIAIVDNEGNVTATGMGVATITVNSKSNSEKVANCLVFVTEEVQKITLDKDNIIIGVNENNLLTATIEPKNATDKELEWKSSDENIVAVDNTGKVTAIGIGTATITASLKSNNEKMATCKIIVADEVQEIFLDKENIIMEKDESETLTAIIKPESAIDKELEWKSSDENIATVNEEGKVIATGSGTTIITVSSKSNSEKMAICIVTVMDKEEKQQEIQEAEEKQKVEEKQETEKAQEAEKTREVEEAQETEEVEEKQEVEEPQETPKIVEVEEIEMEEDEKYTLNKESVILSVNGNKRKTAQLKTNGDKDIKLTWNSSNEKVATVDQNGKITAKSKGTAKIIATDKNGNSAVCNVTVKISIKKITLSTKSTNIYPKTKTKTYTLIATVTPNNATDKDKITWSSSNEKVATVDQNGKVTGISNGTAIITAKAPNKKKATCEIHVNTKVKSDGYVYGYAGKEANKLYFQQYETKGATKIPKSKNESKNGAACAHVSMTQCINMVQGLYKDEALKPDTYYKIEQYYIDGMVNNYIYTTGKNKGEYKKGKTSKMLGSRQTSLIMKTARDVYGVKCEKISDNESLKTPKGVKNILKDGGCIWLVRGGKSEFITGSGKVKTRPNGSHCIMFYKYENGCFYAKDDSSSGGPSCKYTEKQMKNFLKSKNYKSTYAIYKNKDINNDLIRELKQTYRK